MRIIDANNNPITDVSTLADVEAATANATAEVDASHDAATADASRAAFDGPASTDEVSEPDEQRLSPRDYMVARLRKIRVRLAAYAGQATDRQSLADALIDAAQSLDLAVAGAACLPPDWRPAREPAPSSEIQAGTHVVIRSKRRATYADDLSPEDMDDLVVMRVGEKRLRCHCVASGMTVLIPAAHVDRR